MTCQSYTRLGRRLFYHAALRQVFFTESEGAGVHTLAQHRFCLVVPCSDCLSGARRSGRARETPRNRTGGSFGGAKEPVSSSRASPARVASLGVPRLSPQGLRKRSRLLFFRSGRRGFGGFRHAFMASSYGHSAAQTRHLLLRGFPNRGGALGPAEGVSCRAQGRRNRRRIAVGAWA